MRLAARPSPLVAAAAVVVLLVQLGGIAHVAFAAHVRCEHGEFVEAPRVQPPAPPPAGGISAGRTETELAGDHQHCLAQLHARAQADLSTFELPISPPAWRSSNS